MGLQLPSSCSRPRLPEGCPLPGQQHGTPRTCEQHRSSGSTWAVGVASWSAPWLSGSCLCVHEIENPNSKLPVTVVSQGRLLELR